MQVRIYSVYDDKAKVFRFPHTANTNGQAIRSFSEAANDKSNEIGKFPTEFTLYEHGVFDDETGVITPHLPVDLGRANAFVVLREREVELPFDGVRKKEEI